MSKISITLDVSKFSRDRIAERKYTNRDNKEVVVKEYKVDLVELKEPKVISQGDTWVLKKTHFVSEQQTKEEQKAKVPSKFVGEGFQFFDKEVDESQEQAVAESGAEEHINVDDIPF